jgi:type II pantothenate kinase
LAAEGAAGCAALSDGRQRGEAGGADRQGHGNDAGVRGDLRRHSSAASVIDGERNLRIGGTGLGGGTIVGLARLLTGLDEYEAIVTAAAKGDRGTADLKVRHIYEGMEPPIDGDLTASNFGRVFPGAVIGSGEEGSISREDALASVIGMVGEAVATLCVHAAAAHGVKTIVYIGSSFNGNAPLRQAVESYTRFRGGEPHFVENGEFSGALGALLRLGRG